MMTSEKAVEAEESLGDSQEDFGGPHVAELPPKDPRTKAKYNVFSRLLFL